MTYPKEASLIYPPRCSLPNQADSGALADEWLGRQDSNLGMPESKSGALPLGDAPIKNQARGTRLKVKGKSGSFS
jgi:hypothetical protein